MVKLGGRKFVGFAILCGVGLYMGLRGTTIDANVVTLLLGAYAVFAGTNAFAGYAGSDSPSSADPVNVDAQIEAFLNTRLMPQLNQLAQSHQATAAGLGQLTEHVTKLSQQAAPAKVTAESYRQMLANIDKGLTG